MTPPLHVEPLSQRHRRWLFIGTVLSFVIVVPLLVFYAIGYRFDWSDPETTIRAVGGMYISADADNIAIYIDDEPVEDMRIFQNAAYIQNLDAGLHQVHVQGDNLNTWVKVLPVYSHFVTEAVSFNVPVRSQIRLITEYKNTSGESIVTPSATSSFSFASTTNQFFVSSSSPKATWEENPEYVYLTTRFASTSAERQMIEQARALENERFFFPSQVTDMATVTATTTKLYNDMILREAGDEVEAVWVGDANKRPYSFCVTYTGVAATALAYGSHVMDDLETELASTTNLSKKSLVGTTLCRDSIRIDRLWQSVQSFYFVPGAEDLVLMHLQDGVYVVEIDDRGWQNTQLLYPGDYLEVIVESGSIFIKDGEYLLEVFTDIVN